MGLLTVFIVGCGGACVLDVYDVCGFRKRGLERMVRAEKLRLEIAETKRKRTARKREIWEERQEMLDEKRKGELALLVEACRNWVTEEKLEKEVERVVDEFFVEGERRGEGSGDKVKVVGW